MLVSRELPSKSSKLPCVLATNKFTSELFNNNTNFTNIGAIQIAAAPKNSLNKLSFASTLLSSLIPATIIFQDNTTIAIKIGPPIIPAILQYQVIIKSQFSCVNGDKSV